MDDRYSLALALSRGESMGVREWIVGRIRMSARVIESSGSSFSLLAALAG